MLNYSKKNIENYTAVILAGGKGTRIQSLFPEIPKPLIEFSGKSVLFWQLNSILNLGIKKIFVLAGYKGELIKKSIEENYDNRVDVIIEDYPLGTFGCLSLIKNDIKTKYFVLLSGDLIFNIDFIKFFTFHEQKNSQCTLTVHSNFHPLDADLIEYDDSSGLIKNLITRPHPDNFLFLNNVNAAVSIVNTELIKNMKENLFQNFEKDFIPSLLTDKILLYAYKSIDYIRDIGTPDRFNETSKEMNQYFSNKLTLLSEREIVFFDIIRLSEIISSYHINEVNEITFEILKLNKPKYLTVGYCPKNSIERKIIETFLGNHHIKFDIVFEYMNDFEKELPVFMNKFELNIKNIFKFAFEDVINGKK